MVNVANGYAPILDLYREVSKAQDAGALVASLSMVFVGIDTLAWLSLPLDGNSVQRADFCTWVDTYLKTDTQQPYQYVGIDVYAARCAMLHHYGITADLHNRPNPPKRFGYLDNGPHQVNGSSLVLISLAVLIRDFGTGIGNFIQAAQQNADLKARIDNRVPQLVQNMSIQTAP